MKAIADTLEVSRSNLAERAAGDRRSRGPYRRTDDPLMVAALRRLVDARPTYGYRRITALLNRQRVARGLPRLNHKRIYRLMRLHGMLLEPHTGHRPGRVHDGKVTVMRSNLRWCSDAFEILCWNKEVVRVGFTLDAHDREAISWVGVAGCGISGDDVRDMMLEGVEKRFGTDRAPHAVEWLSDNGSPYTAKETRQFAGQLNLVSCFTPVRSPESNGLAEAFVKTFKRDYVRVNPLSDAQTVLRLLDGWFEDYNENHPHSRLGMRSPREFIRAMSETAACPV
jgi:transposase InsO family protein